MHRLILLALVGCTAARSFSIGHDGTTARTTTPAPSRPAPEPEPELHGQALADAYRDAERKRILRDIGYSVEDLRSQVQLTLEVDRGFACLLKGSLDSVMTKVGILESTQFRDKARAHVTEAELAVEPARDLMMRCEKLKANRKYKALQNRVTKAKKRLEVARMYEGLYESMPSCGSEADKSRACRAAHELARLEEDAEAIERDHGLGPLAQN